MTARDTTVVDTVVCTGCKSKTNVKVVFASSATPSQLRYKSSTPETEPKKLKPKDEAKPEPKANPLEAELKNITEYTKQLESIIDGQG